MTDKVRVDLKSIEIEGIDMRDRPDFSDAFVSYAEWEDGTPLTESEMDSWQDKNGHVVNQLIHERLV